MSLMAFANLFSTKIKIADKTTLQKSDDDFYEYMRNLYKEKGAVWDEVNIFGIRDTADMDKGIWNDWICLAIYGRVLKYRGTCDPSAYWTKEGGCNTGGKGVAHICLGWYPNAYQIGIHKGYEAVCQWGNKITIWRDGNNNFRKDDSDIIETGYFGCNIHRALIAKNVNKIGRFSAGCQVIRNSEDFADFLGLIKSSNKYKKNKKAKFGYLLLSKLEIPEVYLS